MFPEIHEIADMHGAELGQGFQSQIIGVIGKCVNTGDGLGVHVQDPMDQSEIASAGVEGYRFHGLITRALFWPPKPKFSRRMVFGNMDRLSLTR